MTKYPILVYSVGGPGLKISDLSILPGLPRGIMAVVPSDLYPYIYGFLVNNSLPKTAKAFLKEAKSVRRRKFLRKLFYLIQVPIPCTFDGDGLLEIYSQYRT